MKNVLKFKSAKIAVDILLLIGVVMIIPKHHNATIADNLWYSSHCVTGVIFSLLMLVHIFQNWRLINAFTKRKVILRNKITFLTVCSFILIVASIALLALNSQALNFHHAISRLFLVIIIIHVIDKAKRFFSLFKK